MSKFEIPLLGEADQPRNYRVKLHFCRASDQPSAGRVRLQDRVEEVTLGDSVESEATIHEFSDIRVEHNMAVELLPAADGDPLPTLAAIEVIAD